jgi:hypothetical protein
MCRIPDVKIHRPSCAGSSDVSQVGDLLPGGIVDADDPGTQRLAELRVSARGWHGVQLAVLGFIGLCGVLADTGSDGTPHWLRVLAGVLVLVALGLACVATVLVALAAWPTYGPGSGVEDPGRELSSTGVRLRTGILLTFVSVAVLAVATSSTWWPSAASGGADAQPIRVSTSGGELCGELGESSSDGRLALAVDGRLVQVPLAEIVAVVPVASC